ncbi:MAG: repair protein RecO [Candidatus Saccharibacteria bacterium]|nr:repair protein RecO [Candidatus Saccharibacteria bacterium]
MKQIITTGIVLSRTDFQEADRIVKLLTPDHGKVSVIAKGVRRPKSKLAGGIELFSESDITFIPGRGDLATLVSSRLLTHYGDIVKDIQRTMLGYALLKRLNRATEDAAEPEYYAILKGTLQGLNDLELPSDALELWFTMQVLYLSGHIPNLRTDTAGNKLAADKSYLFEFDEMAFKEQEGGPYSANHIKLLRLGYAAASPLVLRQIKGSEEAAAEALKLSKNLLTRYVRV